MNFGDALQALKDGRNIHRLSWNAPGQYVYLHTFPTFQPVCVLLNAQGLHQPGWVPSIGDLMAEDWQVK